MWISRSKSCVLEGIDEEKPVFGKPHFFSTGLSGVNFSWSFVLRGTLLSASRSSASSKSSSASSSSSSSTNSWTSRGSTKTSRSCSRSTSSWVSSRASLRSASRSSSSCRLHSLSWRSLWSLGWWKHQKRDKYSREPHEDKNVAQLLDRLPFTESGKFLTVYVGVRSDQTVKYVISRSLVSHPLFQVMLKVSEDESGIEDSERGRGVSIMCDPELFLEVVRSVDGNLDSVQKVELESSSSSSDEGTPIRTHGDQPEIPAEAHNTGSN